MRKLLFLIVLSGCATQPPEPTQGQLAMWAYWSSLCGKPATYENVQLLLANDAPLRGCVISHATNATAAYNANSGPNVLEASGQALMQGSGVQQQCSTRPDYAGGWITTCR